MPDAYGIGMRAFEDIDVNVEAKLLEMEYQGIADDSQRVDEIMAGLDSACIITLGADGTNRLVAYACGDTPFLPISPGTNNVFDEDNEERADWVEDLREPEDHGYIKDKAKVVYFIG